MTTDTSGRYRGSAAIRRQVGNLAASGAGFAVILVALSSPAATAAATKPAPAGRTLATSARQAGDVFQDCSACPEMVVLPAGTASIGSTEAERRKLGVMTLFDRMETPRHSATIARPFAVGRFSITFADWDACIMAGGCDGYLPDDAGWGRGRRPLINVNWADAQSYIGWLSHTTGHKYRLLSEAEWEYAARGGRPGYFSFGDTIDDSKANYGGHRGKTLEVGSYPPNGFGLYDMGGNTAQWTQDCYHGSYAGAPADGSPWLTGACRTRNVRGGGWSLTDWTLRAAQRIGDPPEARNTHLGFRVARDL